MLYSFLPDAVYSQTVMLTEVTVALCCLFCSITWPMHDWELRAAEEKLLVHQLYEAKRDQERQQSVKRSDKNNDCRIM